MYYKIVNKDCEVYQKLFNLRQKEHQINEENLKAIKEKIGLEFDKYFGHNQNGSFIRTKRYIGFVFKEPEKVNLKIWKKYNKDEKTFIPNKQTKLGREMFKFLENLKISTFTEVTDILGINIVSPRFTYPIMEIINDTILLHINDSNHVEDENIIEITYKEFQEIAKRIENK